MSASMPPWFAQRFFDLQDVPEPLAGGTYNTYAPGTLTPKVTYSDYGRTTPNLASMPINADGLLSYPVFFSGSYRIIIKDALGNTIHDVDNITGSSGASASVSNVTELRSLPYSAGAVAFTTGYYTAGDNGAWAYYWDENSTANDNGGNVIESNSSPASGRWIGLTVDTFNARQFGLKLDGTTDDTAQWDNMIAAVTTNIKTIEIPTGTLKLTSNKSVPSGIKVKFGMNAKISGAITFTVPVGAKIEAGLHPIIDTTTTLVLGRNTAPEFYVQWWGAIGNNSADDTSAINKAIIGTEGSYGHLVFSNGEFRVTTVNFTNIQDITVTFRGVSVLRGTSASGTDIVKFSQTTGGACQNLIINNMVVDCIVGASYRYGVHLVGDDSITDIQFNKLRVIANSPGVGSGTITDYGLYLDNLAFNNEFISTEIQTSVYLIGFGSDNVNRNTFVGGRLRGTSADATTGTIGIVPSGAANSFTGVDISNCRYVVIGQSSYGLTFDKCYFESMGKAIIGYGEGSGNCDGMTFRNCLIISSKKMWHFGADTSPHRNNNFIGNYFKNMAGSPEVPADIFDTFTGNQYLTGVYFENNFWENVATGALKYTDPWNKEWTIIDGPVRWTAGVKTYSINKGPATGTVVIDSVVNLTGDVAVGGAGIPAITEILAVGYVDATTTKSFKFSAVFDDSGNLISSSYKAPLRSAPDATYSSNEQDLLTDLNNYGDFINVDSGITSVAVSSGNLQVANLVNANWNFYIRSHIWAD